MNDLSQYYEILELELGASQRSVKQAYRDLTKVWHPDRFEGDPRLKQKAEQKLKRINDAYERLQLVQPDRQAKPKHAKPKSGPNLTSTKEHQPASVQPKDQSHDGCLLQAIADQLRSGAPIDSLRFVLMLENIGLACYKTDRAKVIFEGMRGNPNWSSRGGVYEIDCAKVRSYLRREWAK